VNSPSGERRKLGVEGETALPFVTASEALDAFVEILPDRERWAVYTVCELVDSCLLVPLDWLRALAQLAVLSEPSSSLTSLGTLGGTNGAFPGAFTVHMSASPQVIHT